MLDICVVSYNTVDKLKRFLETVNLSDPSLWNLYVADNGSTDGSQKLIEDNMDTYNITKAFYNENIGFASACNQLAALGDSEIVGLFNADVWMVPGHVNNLLETLAENPNIAILGPKQMDERHEIVHAGIFGPMTAPTHRGWRESDPTDSMYKDLVQCLTVSGSAYLVRRSVWDSLTSCPIYQEQFECDGAFLPTKHYYDETWCSYHAIAHGYEVWYDGRMPSFGHSWHASSTVGGFADALFTVSQKMFREACDNHGIPHD